MSDVRAFLGWPKTPRLFRDVVITEKIDGTNAAVVIEEVWDGEEIVYDVYPQSRKRVISIKEDNHGFARWVEDNRDTLINDLGPGRHFGEWWGSGINRGYGMPNGVRYFSLFNTRKWADADFDTQGLLVVPILRTGVMSDELVRAALSDLATVGSFAAPGFMRPEGVCVFHVAAQQVFKATLENDEESKGEALARERNAA